jgi:hypothetical protein
VSINLCTDQLAMMLAAPGQLVSVSDLAADPHSSAMAREARAFPANHGRAEEVYLLRPDLVLAGAYSDPATVAMLRRVGLRVVQFDTARSLADTRDRIAQMARLLGREAAGAALIAAPTPATAPRSITPMVTAWAAAPCRMTSCAPPGSKTWHAPSACVAAARWRLNGW